MKKFVFQLDARYRVKRTEKDRLQKEYAEAEAAREGAVRKKEELEQKIEEESAKYEARARAGMAVSEILAHNTFFQDLQKRQRTAAAEAERARLAAERKQQELLEVFREIKTLEKLREKQYEDYLAEEGKRETGRMEDLLSYNITEIGMAAGKAL